MKGLTSRGLPTRSAGNVLRVVASGKAHLACGGQCESTRMPIGGRAHRGLKVTEAGSLDTASAHMKVSEAASSPAPQGHT